MTHPVELVALIVASYLLGSIPFGMIVARRHGVDIFKSGSGNPGATNVWRAAGTGAGFLVFFLDVGKGLVPAVAARFVEPNQEIWLLVGLVAVLGHSFSPFVSFRGGKGVSTALGAALGAAPWVALSAFGVFCLVAATCRYVSLASTLAVISTILFIYLIPGQSKLMIPVFAALSLFVVWRHRANYARLVRGEEPKFRFKNGKRKEDEPDKDDR